MPVRVGTAEEGGTFHAQGMALKLMLEAGIVDQVEIVPPESARHRNAQLLGAGPLAFGFMSPNCGGRGEVDAQLQCPLPNKVMTDLTRRSAIRPLFYRTNELYHVLERAPIYRGTVLAKGAIPGMQEDLPQVAVVNLLMTHLGADAKL